jgi:predicted AlkP superfamily pyrophosphatase or phosphodiesterase
MTTNNNKLVIHISVDGLSPIYVNQMGKYGLPNLFRLKMFFTDVARSDKYNSTTLPNHISMFTGKTVDEHNIHHNKYDNKYDNKFNNKFNNDTFFKKLKNKNIRTALFVGKDKFFLTCCLDVDVFVFDNNYKLKRTDYVPIPLINIFLENFENIKCDYNFIHFRGTDSAGHEYGWGSDEYIEALKSIDNDIGLILKMLDDKQHENYIIILTSDHGGSGYSHGDFNNPANYTIPFYVFMKQYDNNLYNLDDKHDLYKLMDRNILTNPIQNKDVALFIKHIYNL